jgi:CBS domain-containing protein
MKVESILKSKGNRVVTMRPEASIATVVHRLKIERIGAVVISSDGATVAGILSERDVLHGLAEHGAEVLRMKADDLMTREVVTCAPGDGLRQIMGKMTSRRIRHLPVLEEGRLCGMISIGDVVKSRVEEVELEATVLRDAYIAMH